MRHTRRRFTGASAATTLTWSASQGRCPGDGGQASRLVQSLEEQINADSRVKVETVDSKHEETKDEQQQQPEATEPRPCVRTHPQAKEFGLDCIIFTTKRKGLDQDREPCRSQEAQPRNLRAPGLRDCQEVAAELLDLLLVQCAEPGLVKTKIAELFSPPPPWVTLATGALPSFAALVPGSIFDLRVDVQGKGWNFFRADHRCAARRQLHRKRPYLVVGAPLSRNLCVEPTTMIKRRVEAGI